MKKRFISMVLAPTMSFTSNGMGIGFGSTFGRDLCASSANLTL